MEMEVLKAGWMRGRAVRVGGEGKCGREGGGRVEGGERSGKGGRVIEVDGVRKVCGRGVGRG